MKRPISSLLLAAALMAAPSVLANDVVEIRLGGYYYAEPATVRFIVAVTPDPSYQTLRIEAITPAVRGPNDSLTCDTPHRARAPSAAM